jgi:hypothetical protein
MRDSQRSVTPENPPWAQWALESSPIMTPEAQILTCAASGKMFPALARYYAEVGDNTASSCSMSAKPFGKSPGASFIWPLAL